VLQFYCSVFNSFYIFSPYYWYSLCKNIFVPSGSGFPRMALSNSRQSNDTRNNYCKKYCKSLTSVQILHWHNFFLYLL